MKINSGRGRRKGAVSFVTVTLDELNTVLKGGAQIPVSRLWAEGFGLSGKPIVSNTKNIASLAPIVQQEDSQPINVTKNQW